MGERVGVGWQADSCGICEWCRQGDEHLVRTVAADVRGTEWRLCGQDSGEFAVCDSGADGAGERECGSAAVRRDYGVQPAAESWGEAVVAGGNHWDWRAGASWGFSLRRRLARR